MRTSPVALTVAVATALLLPAGAAHAAPPGVNCGDTLTSSVRLTADLTCDSGDGLIATAALTIDLGGHTLRGTGGSTGLAEGAGVRVATADEVTVTHGTVTGWARGIDGEAEADIGATTINVSGAAFTGNERAIWGSNTTLTVAKSKFRNNDDGVAGLNIFATIDQSEFRENQRGASADLGGTLTISDSKFRRNELATACSETSLVVTGSSFTSNRNVATSFNCGGVVFRASTFTRNAAVYQSGSYSFGVDEFTGNKFTSNGDVIDALASAAVRDNKFIGNQVALHAEADPLFGGTLTVERNQFIRNTDAIVSSMPGVIAANLVVKNSGIGIDAPNATDGGGNVAYKNGVEPQCTGVVCRLRN